MTETGHKPGRFGDLWVRTVSGLALGLLSLFCVAMGGIPVFLLTAALLSVLLWEYHEMVCGKAPRQTLSAAVLMGGGLVAIAAAGTGTPAIGFVLIVAASLVAGLLAPGKFAWIAGGGIYIGVAIGCLLLIRIGLEEGFAIMCWVVMVVIACDVAAYFSGRTFGGPKLCRAISPNKTWAGAIGGLGGAALMSLVFALFLGWPELQVMVFGLVTAAASQVGDLGESWLKRRAGIKDSGCLLPGHGGFLDRLDGILGAAWAVLFIDAFVFGIDLAIQ